MQRSWTEVLTRLRPVLEPIFDAYGVAPPKAQEIVEEACLVWMTKRPEARDLENWLLRTILETCERLASERRKPSPP